MAFVAAIVLALCLQTSETKEFRISLRTKDGSTFSGTCRLPAKLSVTTKYGEYSPDTGSFTQITRSDESWILVAATGPVTGKLKLGALTLQTPGGSLKISEEDIVSFSIQGVVEAAPPSVVASDVGAKTPKAATPAFKGYEFRKHFVDDSHWERHADFALLLSDGKQIAVLDRETSDCVFIDAASGTTTRVRVDAGAFHLIERNRKVYVANSQAKTITVIDTAALRPIKVIGVSGSPKWFAAPAFGSTVYVAVENSESKVQCLNTQTDTLSEPLEYSQQERNCLGGLHFIQVTPDNRVMVTIAGGLVDPTLFEITGLSLTLSKRMGEKHWPSFWADWSADRTYLGSHIYSADFKKRLASLPIADILVPHPTRRLLFGRKCPPPKPSQLEVNRGTSVLVLDEETFQVVTEIEVGDRVLALVPAEDVLYVVSESRLYPIELKRTVPAEALAPMKPVRNPVDLATLAAAGTTTKRSLYSLPRIGGWTLLEDQRTLALGLTEKAEILFIDTIDGAELRRAALDFQPGSMAVQGDSLYAIRTNSSLLYALETATGKLKKEIKIPGDPLVRVSCAPKGRLFASNSKGHIMSIDPATGSAINTGARGLFLQTDPKGQFVYSGRTSPNDWGVDVEQDKDGRTTWYYDQWGYRSTIRKYAISGTSLREVAVNDNTAVNGRAMVLSPDGSKIASVGGGGWRPKGSGGGAGGYTIAIYDTKDLTTVLGQVDLGAYPENIAFHPVLDIGAALKSDSEITLFNTKSMAVRKRWQVKGAPQGFNEPGALKFAGRGETLLYWQMSGSMDKNAMGKLYLIPLELSAEEKASLGKAYGNPAAGADTAKLFRDAEEAERKGDKAGAVRLYRQIVQEDPASEFALKASKKVLALEDAGATPENVAAGWLRTANALLENGDTDRALRYYKRILDEQPNSPEASLARKKVQELDKK
ncbi:MAG TPA: tetratricopeptide repeat protein [Planctomycetota bacterium]|nr:tetratricopeptide repeat protein [Planctomycetota bacterium]